MVRLTCTAASANVYVLRTRIVFPDTYIKSPHSSRLPSRFQRPHIVINITPILQIHPRQETSRRCYWRSPILHSCWMHRLFRWLDELSSAECVHEGNQKDQEGEKEKIRPAFHRRYFKLDCFNGTRHTLLYYLPIILYSPCETRCTSFSTTKSIDGESKPFEYSDYENRRYYLEFWFRDCIERQPFIRLWLSET